MTLPFLKSVPGEDPVRLERHFNATVDRMYRAWTDPNELLQWFGPGQERLSSAKADVCAGGLWEFSYADRNGVQDTLKGEYVEVVPNSRLVFTWTHERRSGDGVVRTTAPSLVTVTFQERKAGVTLTLLHERIVEKSGRLGVAEGWNGAFGNLARLLVSA